MSIDTKAKRFSMLTFGDGALLPDPDGSIDTIDRAYLLWLYSGVALESPEVAVGLVELTLHRRSVELELETRSVALELLDRSVELELPEDDR